MAATGLDSYGVALDLRDVIRMLARQVVDDLAPQPRYGVVQAVGSNQADVLLTGDGSPIKAAYGVFRPVVGQLVRVVGKVGARYIEDTTNPRGLLTIEGDGTNTKMHIRAGATEGVLKWNGTTIAARNAADSGYIALDASAFNINSARERKVNITDVSIYDLLREILDLKVHSFQYVDDDQPRFGLVADEAAEVFGDAIVMREGDGMPYAIDISSLLAALIAAVQALYQEVKSIGRTYR